MATTSKRKPTGAAKKTTVKAPVKAPVKVAVKAPAKAAVKAPAKVATKVVSAPTPPTALGAAVKAPTSPLAAEPHMLRKKELIERVVARSGVKKKDAKPTIEAMLAVLGEALSKGEELNLHPLGKMKVTRVIEKPNAKVMVTKVRRKLDNAGGTVVKITPNS